MIKRLICDFADARLSELNAVVGYYQAAIALEKALGLTDEKQNIRVYDVLSTQTHFHDSFSIDEQKRLKQRK